VTFGADSADSLVSVTFVDGVDGSGYVFSSSGQVSFGAASSGACYSYSGIHWASNKIPVGYSVSIGPGAPSSASAAIQAGFQVWNSAGTSFSFRMGGGSSVSWGRIDGSGKILAVATVWYDPGSKEIARATVTFDSSEKWATDGRTKDAYDVQNTAAHEAGHWLMLNDVGCPEETMYRYVAPGETKKRSLGSGDIAGVRFIYGGGSAAGHRITVTVTDSATRGSVYGASVYLDGVRKGTTDYQGKVTISAVAKGSHTITVKKVGYQEATQRFFVQRDMSVTISLQSTR